MPIDSGKCKTGKVPQGINDRCIKKCPRGSSRNFKRYGTRRCYRNCKKSKKGLPRKRKIETRRCAVYTKRKYTKKPKMQIEENFGGYW